ncbi:hypothetical protein COH20_011134 [Aspergillus flavus]|nr:hypothetical protein COH20_011134 [Aspergillus flavus]RAQ70861.1 hypothetical protein COH21_004473 [Aspergillus flavus]
MAIVPDSAEDPMASNHYRPVMFWPKMEIFIVSVPSSGRPSPAVISKTYG